jgi:hypothetical protein
LEVGPKRKVVSIEFVYHFDKFGKFWTLLRGCFAISNPDLWKIFGKEVIGKAKSARPATTSQPILD